MKNREDIIKKENEIRNYFDEKSGEFYFSIVDTIENLGLSKDSRNYWKVLKSRLKNTHNQLVTECNQLKMKASDGKYYLTDATKANTILQIIQIVSPEKVSEFEEFFNVIERKGIENYKILFNENLEEKKISTVSFDEGELKVDMYEKNNCIFFTTIIPGVEPENILISLNVKSLSIKVSRQNQSNIDEESYDYQELIWGKFSRILDLPFEVDIDRVETNFQFGILFIKLYILDKTRTKIVTVK